MFYSCLIKIHRVRSPAGDARRKRQLDIQRDELRFEAIHSPMKLCRNAVALDSLTRQRQKPTDVLLEMTVLPAHGDFVAGWGLRFVQ